MSAANVEFRDLELEDVPVAIELYKKEDWATSVETVVSQIEHFGPRTFQAAYSKLGQLIGTCGVYRLTDSISYIDYVLVAEKYRRQGISFQLVSRALEYVKDTNIVLDSYPEFESMYRKIYGFKRDQPMFEMNLTIPGVDKAHMFQKGMSISSVTSENIENVMTYDITLHPLGHRSYFRHLLLDKDSVSLCSIQNGRCDGIILYSSREQLLNSLYADDPSIAKTLLSGLMYTLATHSTPGDSTTKAQTVLLEQNTNIFKRCVDELGIQSEGPNLAGVRMVSQNSVPNMAYDKIYSTVYFNAYIL